MTPLAGPQAALEPAVGAAMLVILTFYTILGGADFGGGVWDLLARGPSAGAQRQAIARAMGPVWEANHVWLIFFLVLLFSAFPSAYAALSIAFFIPFHLVLVGIILRGAAFVFRSHGALAGTPRRAWASAFGAASTITPFLLGAALAAVSSGGIRVHAGQIRVDVWHAWLSPFSLATGALALALCAYLAAVFLTLETAGGLQAGFRTRALAAGAAVAVLAALALALMAPSAPRLWANLWHLQAAPLLLSGALLTVLSAWAVWFRRYPWARALAVIQVAVLLGGWALAQWPYLIYPDLTVWNTAAPRGALRMMLWTIPPGVILLVPSLWLLFAVFKRPRPGPR